MTFKNAIILCRLMIWDTCLDCMLNGTHVCFPITHLINLYIKLNKLVWQNVSRWTLLHSCYSYPIILYSYIVSIFLIARILDWNRNSWDVGVIIINWISWQHLAIPKSVKCLLAWQVTDMVFYGWSCYFLLFSLLSWFLNINYYHRM